MRADAFPATAHDRQIAARSRAQPRTDRPAHPGLAQAAETHPGLAVGAVRAGQGFLSRLERGEKSASVGTLHTVAGALGSSLSALLGEADPQTEIQIVRAADRHRMTTAPGPGEHIYEAITLGSSHSGLSVMVVEVGTHGAHTEAHHGGDELIFVLDGRIRVHFGGHTVLLERDDSVRFPGYLPHSLSAEGRKLARALVVIASG